MIKWAVVLLSLCTSVIMYSQDVLRVSKVDGTVVDYKIDPVANLTFTDVTNQLLQIKKNNGEIIYFDVNKIENLTFSDVTVIEQDQKFQNMGINLVRNYPNPFNPETTISFNIDKDGLTNVSVYNHLGQFVTELHSGQLKAGRHSLKWDASERSNSSGVYLVKISQNNEIVTSSMILIK